MVQRIVISGLALLNFSTGFIMISYGFGNILTLDPDSSLVALLYTIFGLFLIFLSAKIHNILKFLLLQKYLNLRIIKLNISLFMILLFTFSFAYAQEKPSGLQLKNIEFGSSQIKDSEAEFYRSYFTLFKFRAVKMEDLKLWVRWFEKKDRFGNESRQSFLLEMTPRTWLSFSMGYNQMPVSSVKFSIDLGRFHLDLRGSREAVISRTNAISQGIDLLSGYVEITASLSKDLYLSFSTSRGLFGDDNKIKSSSFTLITESQANNLNFTLYTGYGERILNHYSDYYWSPNIYREIYLAPEIGFEINSFWLDLTFSIDYILEEHYSGDLNGLSSWGGNGEISLGYKIGPGYLYLTGRYWNSSIQRANIAYSGTIFEASYEVIVNK